MDLITIDKTYSIRYSTMTDAQWDALATCYTLLPGFLGVSEPDGDAGWFGWEPAEGGEDGPYLWTSVEPGGLQVGGRLSPEDWAAWDTAFMALASEMLGFPVHDAED